MTSKQTADATTHSSKNNVTDKTIFIKKPAVAGKPSVSTTPEVAAMQLVFSRPAVLNIFPAPNTLSIVDKSETEKKADVHSSPIAYLLGLNTTITSPKEHAAADKLMADSFSSQVADLLDMQVANSLDMHTAALVIANNTVVTDTHISDAHQPLPNMSHGNTIAIKKYKT